VQAREDAREVPAPLLSRLLLRLRLFWLGVMLLRCRHHPYPYCRGVFVRVCVDDNAGLCSKFYS
jgi:hypothetical protein